MDGGGRGRHEGREKNQPEEEREGCFHAPFAPHCCQFPRSFRLLEVRCSYGSQIYFPFAKLHFEATGLQRLRTDFTETSSKVDGEIANPKSEYEI